MSSIGLRIRNRRIDVKMTTEDLADAIGCTPQTIRNWESGRTEMRPYYLQFLAKALGCEPDEIAPQYKPTFGGNLKRLRAQSRLPAEAIAKMLGVDESTWYAYEANTAFPSSKVIPRIARILDCGIMDIFRDLEEVRRKSKNAQTQKASED